MTDINFVDCASQVSQLVGALADPQKKQSLKNALDVNSGVTNQTLSVIGANLVLTDSAGSYVSMNVPDLAGWLLSSDPDQSAVLDGQGRIRVPKNSTAALLWATWPLGNSQQLNGGRGIDGGNHFRNDMRIGMETNIAGMTFTDLGGAVLPSGVYLGSFTTNLFNTGGTYASQPIVVALKSDAVYGYPGVFQYDLIVRSQQSSSASVAPGTLTGTYIFQSPADFHFAFDKGDGSLNAVQGFVQVIKIA